jgi:hypothetical protein
LNVSSVSSANWRENDNSSDVLRGRVSYRFLFAGGLEMTDKNFRRLTNACIVLIWLNVALLCLALLWRPQ